MNREITLHINGREQALTIDDADTLLEVLRDGLKLWSVRESCGVGACGSCTVLMDGRPVSSCCTLAWEARDAFDDDDDEIPEATIDFSVNKTDFLGFYIFDASKQGTYNLQYTDGTIFSFIAAKTDNQDDDEGFYRFIGFINTHSTAQINRFWVTNGGSRYGIDEIEWGRGKHEVPEPGVLWLLSIGGAIILTRRRRRFTA